MAPGPLAVWRRGFPAGARVAFPKAVEALPVGRGTAPDQDVAPGSVQALALGPAWVLGLAPVPVSAQAQAWVPVQAAVPAPVQASAQASAQAPALAQAWVPARPPPLAQTRSGALLHRPLPRLVPSRVRATRTICTICL